MIRVRTKQGNVVILAHFEYREDYIDLLLKLDYLAPNVRLETADRQMIPVFCLVLERESLQRLNPGVSK